MCWTPWKNKIKTLLCMNGCKVPEVCRVMIALAKLLTLHAHNWNDWTLFVLLALIVCIGRIPHFQRVHWGRWSDLYNHTLFMSQWPNVLIMIMQHTSVCKHSHSSVYHLGHNLDSSYNCYVYHVSHAQPKHYTSISPCPLHSDFIKWAGDLAQKGTKNTTFYHIWH